jgi:hypothetical protein
MGVGAICYKPQAGDCAEMPQSLALKTIALACIFIIARSTTQIFSDDLKAETRFAYQHSIAILPTDGSPIDGSSIDG